MKVNALLKIKKLKRNKCIQQFAPRITWNHKPNTENYIVLKKLSLFYKVSGMNDRGPGARPEQ